MAIANDNIIMRFQRGRIGDLIFRVWGENTVVSKAPDYSKIPRSEAQKANSNRFRGATRYGRRVLNDPVAYAFYDKRRRRNQTVWNVAISDYMKRPRIAEVDVWNYNGQAGNTIRVKTIDNYGIASVIVMIINALGVEVESGMAVKITGSEVWDYKTKNENPEWRGGRVVVRVSDRPGNVTRAEVRLQGLSNW
jgi:hypothetical protein